MDKLILKELIDKNLSIRKISEETGKSFTTIRYWIKKYEMRSNYSKYNAKEYGTHRVCPRCKNSVDISEFYQRRGKAGSSCYCKTCTKSETLERVRKFKSLIVEYKGGKCERCGYDKYQGALEFHHVDPTKKDFSMAHLNKYRFDDRIKFELDKCILVCANCHREIHNEIVNCVVPLGIEPRIAV